MKAPLFLVALSVSGAAPEPSIHDTTLEYTSPMADHCVYLKAGTFVDRWQYFEGRGGKHSETKGTYKLVKDGDGWVLLLSDKSKVRFHAVVSQKAARPKRGDLVFSAKGALFDSEGNSRDAGELRFLKGRACDWWPRPVSAEFKSLSDE